MYTGQTLQQMSVDRLFLKNSKNVKKDQCHQAKITLLPLILQRTLLNSNHVAMSSEVGSSVLLHQILLLMLGTASRHLEESSCCGCHYSTCRSCAGGACIFHDEQRDHCTFSSHPDLTYLLVLCSWP
jgi:hypothetical protein